MPSGRALRNLLKFGVDGDLDAFRRASEEVIQEERKKQHHVLANDLERILYGRPRPVNSPAAIREKVPTDRDRGALLMLREPSRSVDDAAFAEPISAFISELLLEYHHHELLNSYGMRPMDKLLFYGPPGCGKSLCAEILASELGRTLAVVRLDAVVSSFLGETASNLGKVFEFIDSMPMVVLFDEFDAISKERSDAFEHGELKRVVNAVLQMLDAYAGRSLLIAATNHEGMLDSAIWRRFDEVIHFGRPERKQLISLLEIKLRGVRRDFDITDEQVLTLFAGLSPAEIERVLRRAIKDMILRGKEFLLVSQLVAALKRESRIGSEGL